MADSYFKMNGNVMIQRKSGIDSQFFYGPNHNFEIRVENSPIIGTTNSSENNPTSDQLAIYNGATKLWGITEGGWVQNPKTIWFSAWNGAAQDSATIETVQFTSVNQDTSNSYNNTTYKFTSPIDGIYHFSYTMMSGANEYMRSSFYVNGIEQNQVFAENQTYARSVNFIIKFLYAGDYIEVKYNMNNSPHEGNVHSDYRSFVGFLIG
jgi:hypothetical protein